LHTSRFLQAGPADPPTIDVDIDAIYQSAARSVRRWRLEFDCDGAPFIWHGKSKSQAAAELRARRDLSDTHAAFSRFGAQLVTATAEAA
jgi:hypothetical protein